MILNKTGRLEQTAIEWLVRLESPDLTAQEEEAFITWVEASPLHQAAYIKAERLSEKSKGLVTRFPVNDVRKQRYIMSPWQGAMAFCCLFVVFSWFFLKGGATNTLENEFVTSVGEQKVFTLSDGSTIHLNSNSHVRFEVAKGQRIAYLESGETVFSVKPDSARPFDVVTSFGIVRVLGTQFSVKATEDDVIVTVVEGRVGLSAGAEASEAFVSDAKLIADQQLSLKAAKKGAAIKRVDAKAELGWRNKQLSYSDVSLEDVVKDLNRYFEEKIIIQDPALKSLRVAAFINLGSFENTVLDLALTLELQAEFSEDKRVVKLYVKQ